MFLTLAAVVVLLSLEDLKAVSLSELSVQVRVMPESGLVVAAGISVV